MKRPNKTKQLRERQRFVYSNRGQMFMDALEWACDGGLDGLQAETRELLCVMMSQAVRRVSFGKPLTAAPRTKRRRRK